MVAVVVGRATCLLIVGGVLGLAVNAVRPGRIELRGGAGAQGQSACVQPSPPNDAVAGKIEFLSPQQAASLCGDPRTLIADTRTATEFAEGHVTGAIHLPCASSQGAASAALDLLAGKHALIVYGNGTDDAAPVAEELRRRSGSSSVRVAVLSGGFSSWSHAGLACSSGPCADCDVPVHR